MQRNPEVFAHLLGDVNDVVDKEIKPASSSSGETTPEIVKENSASHKPQQ
jgi:hypothetical protein